MKRVYSFCLVFLTLFFISCEKKDIKESLLGKWQRSDALQPGGLMRKAYIFEADGTYIDKIDFFGFNGNSIDELTSWILTTGKFKIESDSLFLFAEERTSWDKDFNSVQQKERLNNNLFQSKIKVTKSTMVLDYLSYPADAPVQTRISYKKVY
ncbi:hypothetical protein MNBD_BACTEROID03-2499 [hydrothermal vent metagenome]|uniref:Lipocalin-like domain-containing protein n=1 Tax=hydrothermal vent metagenome TaxID=652676 RepID=A0A3B0T0L6_9ZZZZ